MSSGTLATIKKLFHSDTDHPPKKQYICTLVKITVMLVL